MALEARFVEFWVSSILRPNSAIIVPLSMQYCFSGQVPTDPRCSHIIRVISLIRSLQATPPPSNNSDFPECASALSATSMHAEKACSWRDQQTAPNSNPSLTF